MIQMILACIVTEKDSTQCDMDIAQTNRLNNQE